MTAGYIDGVDLVQLAAPIQHIEHADTGIRALIFALVGLVLIGFKRRFAGLIVAIAMFMATYNTMFSSGDIVQFWRDLALIVALVWTSRDEKDLSQSEVIGDDELNISIANAPKPPASPPRRRATLTRFREDLSIADLN